MIAGKEVSVYEQCDVGTERDKWLAMAQKIFQEFSINQFATFY